MEYYHTQIAKERKKLNQTTKKFNQLVKELEKYKKIRKQKESELYKEYSGNDPDIECSALTNKYMRCERDVLFTINNINDSSEKFKYKKNVPLCKIHTKQILNSPDKKTLKYGFYYESDLYR